MVDTLPALLVASATTGFAGALFNPAVRAYLARDAGERRVQAFALFSVFYQAGILLGPLAGLALTGISFTLTCLVSAGLFALLTALQVRALPSGRDRRGSSSDRDTGWREILSNRPFLLFAAAMSGSYVLSFQVYLALPLQSATVTATAPQAAVLVAVLFAVSGLVTILGQLRMTARCRERLGPARSMRLGLLTLGAAFLPPLATAALPAGGGVLGAVAIVLSAAVLALGTAIVFPFEMSTIVALSGYRRVATHYGLYNTVCGVGILLRNLGTGWAMDLARSSGARAVPWLVLAVVGAACAAAVHSLRRRGLLPAEEERRRHRGRHRLRRADVLRPAPRPWPVTSDRHGAPRVRAAAPPRSWHVTGPATALPTRSRSPAPHQQTLFHKASAGGRSVGRGPDQAGHPRHGEWW